MLGAIIGDIVGSRWEFNPTNDYNFELFSDKNSYTDDTICTIAVADAILHGSNDFGQYIHSWCRRYPHPMGGYGGRFAQWVMSDNPRPYGSYGNGAAMRVSPVAWASNSQEEILHAAKLTASCTHNHPEGIKGAQAIASAIRNARILREQYGGNWGKEEIRDFVRETVWKFPEYNIDIQIEKVKNRFDETCGGTVPVALWVIQNSTGFEDAIRRAVSLGADADTLGAIVGSIAEALWGIPEWIKKKAITYLPEDMKSVVREFHNRTKNNKPQSVIIYGVEYPNPDTVDWVPEVVPSLTLTEQQYKTFVRGYTPDWECRYAPYRFKDWLYITRSGFWLKKFCFERCDDGLYHLSKLYTVKDMAGKDLIKTVLIEGYFKPQIYGWQYNTTNVETLGKRVDVDVDGGE